LFKNNWAEFLAMKHAMKEDSSIQSIVNSTGRRSMAKKQLDRERKVHNLLLIGKLDQT
jgi:hypothetical protein